MPTSDRKFFSVSIEGGDSTGKATQSELLVNVLNTLGYRAKRVEVPIKSALTHRLIYFMLRHDLATKYPRFFHGVQFLNKYWWQVFTLPKLMCEYDVIILDRWHGSYWVYGLETGLSPDSKLMRLYHVLYSPDVTIVLCGNRVAKEKRDEYEKNDELQDRVNARYADWADMNPAACKIDAGQRVEVVHSEILAILSRLGFIDNPEYDDGDGGGIEKWLR